MFGRKLDLCFIICSSLARLSLKYYL